MWDDWDKVAEPYSEEERAVRRAARREEETLLAAEFAAEKAVRDAEFVASMAAEAVKLAVLAGMGFPVTVEDDREVVRVAGVSLSTQVAATFLKSGMTAADYVAHVKSYVDEWEAEERACAAYRKDEEEDED